MRYRHSAIVAIVVLIAGLGSAWAQIAVTDPATTARNAAIAALKNRIVETVAAQRDRLAAMARRLSADTDLAKYALGGASDGQTLPHTTELSYAQSYRAALDEGDSIGSGFSSVARRRDSAGDTLAGLTPAAREAVQHGLATLDAADSTIIAGTHQTGALRANTRHEIRAINQLEADVTNPSQEQSATAILDKIGGAVLIESRQKQARLQYLAGIVDQLLIDNKRARDTEAALLNMQLRRLRGDSDEGTAGFLSGSGNDLRTWRQP